MRHLKHLWLLAFPALAIAGTELADYRIIIALIIGIAAVVGLVAFGKIQEKLYPWLIFSIGLSLLWSVTLLSPYLIGTDIHVEYYFLHTAQVSGWNSALPYTANSSLPIVVIVPLLAKLLHIDGIWLLKVAFPLLFALVPMMLYYLLKQQLNPKDSFLAAFFFVSMPAFFLELGGIAKQETAEVFFILCLFLIVDRKIELGWQKLGLMVGAGLLVVVSHYTIGIMLLIYLVTGLAILGILRVSKATQKPQFEPIAVIAIVTGVVGFLYYSRVCSGILMHVLAYQASCVVPFDLSILTSLTPGNSINANTVLPIAVAGEHGALAQAALGLDFVATSALGKAFRIFQYATQVLIATGFTYMIAKWRKLGISPVFLAFAVVSALLLGAYIIKPEFAAVLNVSRLYHIALFFLAPMLILGGKLIVKNIKLLTLCLLVPYFLFTSGLVFEVAKCEDTGKVDIPYSVALSNHRMDLGGSLTKSDEVARNWIVENGANPVYADWYGLLFLHERFGVGIGEIAQLPEDLGELPEGSYIFLRVRNNKEESIVLWTGVGLRKHYSYREMGLNKLKLHEHFSSNGSRVCTLERRGRNDR